MSANDNSASGRLIQAAKSGDVGSLAEALSAGADIGTQDHEWHNYTALHWSANHGHKNIILKLLKAGANIDARTNGGLSGLHICCAKGYKEVALLVMGGGAIIDAADIDGFTPLMFASLHGHDQLVVSLLDDAGADVGLKDKKGNTSMHHACVRGNNSVVNILAQHGADINIQNNDGRQPIHRAAFKGLDQTVSNLIQLGADVNCTTNRGSTPLFMASQEGYIDVVNTLLRNGAQGNLTNEGLQLRNDAQGNLTNEGMQAIHVAAVNGHLNVLVKLKEYDMDINAIHEQTQYTPLHYAVANDHAIVAKWLIVNGANPYINNAEGKSAIHLALSKQQTDLVSFMASRNSYLGAEAILSAQATNLECAVCLDQRTTTVMTLPCRHAKVCQRCMNLMVENNDNTCPICRANITQRIPIFD